MVSLHNHSSGGRECCISFHAYGNKGSPLATACIGPQGRYTKEGYACLYRSCSVRVCLHGKHAVNTVSVWQVYAWLPCLPFCLILRLSADLFVFRVLSKLFCVSGCLCFRQCMHLCTCPCGLWRMFRRGLSHMVVLEVCLAISVLGSMFLRVSLRVHLFRCQRNLLSFWNSVLLCLLMSMSSRCSSSNAAEKGTHCLQHCCLL